MTELVVLSHITPIDTPMREEKYFGSCGKLMHGFQAKVFFFFLNEFLINLNK